MLVKIIDCVCSKLCHFHSRGGFPDGRLVCNAHFHTLLDPCRNKPLLFISLAALPPPTNPCIFHETHASGHVSLFGIFYVMHFFFLKVVENWDLPQSRKTGNHEENLGKNAI